MGAKWEKKGLEEVGGDTRARLWEGVELGEVMALVNYGGLTKGGVE